MNTRHDEHYLKCVTALGDTHNVVTNQAIFASNGMKLVEGGIRVNSAFFERLVRHKLLPPIEQCLSVENGINKAKLCDVATSMLNSDAAPVFKALRNDAGFQAKVLQAINSMILLPQLAFKLTVAQEQMPVLFEHSIRVAMFSFYLGLRKGFSEQQQIILLTAALFHDLGMLHVDPELTPEGRRLTSAERHHLYSHPIIAYLILREYPPYHPSVSGPVFEHHERLDGSGYPRALKGNEISMPAQVLMLAEIADSFFSSKAKKQNAERLSVILKLNQQKLNRELCTYLMDLANAANAVAGVELERSGVDSNFEMQLATLSGIFIDWDNTYRAYQENADAWQLALPQLLDERLAVLRRTLLSTGLDTQSAIGMLIMFGDDPAILTELGNMVCEAFWQLTDITHEMRRRWTELAGSNNLLLSGVAGWLDRTESTLQIR